MGQLEGKKAVIVGAAGKGNMGQAIAKRFRKEGADVLVTSRRGAELEEFAREIGGYSTVCDLTKRDDVFALAKVAKEKMGRVDIAINSTGINLGGPFLEPAVRQGGVHGRLLLGALGGRRRCGLVSYTSPATLCRDRGAPWRLPAVAWRPPFPGRARRRRARA